jgi:predicted AlkP superfamily phosphohydrolase/phosphomutase
MTNPRKRLLMVALDAAEPSLVERWMQEGHLPNLSRLRDEGGYGRLRSSAEWLAGSPWPTFHTGTFPGDHGHHHFVQWRKERMDLVRPSPEWLPLPTFWREAGRTGRRVLAIDVPSAYGPRPFDGVEIYGWCNTDLLAPRGSHPPGVFRWARKRFGSSSMPDEVYSMERPQALLRLRDDLIRWTNRTGELALELMEREAWDLCLVNLTAPHRGGHKLWDTTAVRGDVSAEVADELGGALKQVYAACDEVVGRLMRGAEADHVMVFSLHGMGPNTSRVPILSEMLDRILTGRKEPAGQSGALQRLRAMVPNEWRARVKGLLPTRLQDRLTVFWRMGGRDLSSTRVFPVVADLQGYLRVNVVGREVDGIVEPGAEYDRLCEELAEGLAGFVDADCGEPIVAEVMRTDRLYPNGARVDDLPDLIVRWSPTPASSHRRIVSTEHGGIEWPTPGGHPDGRSGNHMGEGFLLTRGEGVPPGLSLEGASIADLAPTAFSILGLPPRPEWVGSVLAMAESV